MLGTQRRKRPHSGKVKPKTVESPSLAIKSGVTGVGKEWQSTYLIQYYQTNKFLIALIILFSFFAFAYYRLVLNPYHSHSQQRSAEESNELNEFMAIDDSVLSPFANKKHIAISIATGIPAARMYLLMASFRKHHDIPSIYKFYLFTDFKDKRLIGEYQRMADHFDIDLVDINPLQDALDEQYMSLFNRKMRFVKINKRRFFMFNHWFKENLNGDEIASVFITDANDVKFQGNIFTLLEETYRSNPQLLTGNPSDNSKPKDLFWFFMEADNILMHTEKWNRRYIKYCFGNDTLKEFYHKHVSCSGTSLGTFHAVESYLSLMAEILTEQGPKFADCLVKPGDQGLHNVILHRQYLEKRFGIHPIRVPNDAGWVLQITTMINHPDFKHRVPEMAETSVVVHQWKWARTLLEKYEKEYNYYDFCVKKKWSNCQKPEPK